MRDRIRVQSTVVGNAGEHLVIGELLRRGVIAALTPRNYKAFDVIVYGNGRGLALRVKTKSSRSKGWMWSAGKDGTVFGLLDQGDISVLVDLGSVEDSNPAYYVIPTEQLEAELRADFEKWVREPGRGGRARSAENWQRRKGDRPEHWEWLNGFRDRWDLILDRLELT